MTINAVVIPKGPILLTGDLIEFKPVDEDGSPVDMTGQEKVALYRYGASVNKPFCDGTHSKIGFQAAEAAVSGG